MLGLAADSLDRRHRAHPAARPVTPEAFARISPRPLTDAERARRAKAQRRVAQTAERAREQVRRALADRDSEIAAAVRAGASQTDIARALGITRQAVHVAVRRASD
jgi:DNA-binding NarL/FixJ family response regulator